MYGNYKGSLIGAIMNNSELQQSVWASKGKDIIEKYWLAAIPRTMWFLEELKKYEYESIYEIGCNSGRNLFKIKNKVVGGIDINSKAIEFAKEKNPKGLFSVGAIQTMPLDKFDIVFSSGVLLHIPPEDIRDVIKSMIGKAAKYVMHMETNGDNSILNGPAHMKPKDKVNKKLFWEPNIVAIYKDLGFKCDMQIIPCGERDARHFLVVNVQK
jgi:SAM-dependent methyltransferase